MPRSAVSQRPVALTLPRRSDLDLWQGKSRLYVRSDLPVFIPASSSFRPLMHLFKIVLMRVGAFKPLSFRKLLSYSGTPEERKARP